MKDKIVVRNKSISKYKANSFKNKDVSIMLKNNLYTGENEYKNNVNVKDLILNYRNDFISIYDTKAENIYFKNTPNLGGITLSFEDLIKNKCQALRLVWNTGKIKSNIRDINIIIKNGNKNIKLEDDVLEEIRIDLNKHKGGNYTLLIRVATKYTEKSYEIDDGGTLEENYTYYGISERDLCNGVLDLTKFKGFKVLALDNINIDTLIINKNDINKVYDMNLYDDVFINKIIIVDNNDMKLFPSIEVLFNDNLDSKENCILSDNGNILIYNDNQNNLRVFNKFELLKDKNVDSVNYVFKEEDIYVLVKYKTLGKYKIVINDKEYMIDRLFTLFIKENMYKYFVEHVITIKKYLNDYDWFGIMDDVTCINFEELYNDYLKFKVNLKKLMKLGFSYKFFMYLYYRKMYGAINIMCSDDFNINKFSKEEINDLNSIAKKYIKKLK